MPILDFSKPKKQRSTAEHNEMHQSDTGIAGTFIPNMSPEDRRKWKAKHIQGKDPRVEIRKTLEPWCQLLVVVRWPKTMDEVAIQMSMNSKLQLSLDDWADLAKAVNEACRILQGLEP